MNNNLLSVIQGSKPFMSVLAEKDIKLYNDIMKNRDVLEQVCHILHVRTPTNRLLVAAWGNKVAIDKYMLYMSPASAVVFRSLDDKRRAMGKLFGYDDEEIEMFVRQAANGCSCDECNMYPLEQV